MTTKTKEFITEVLKESRSDANKAIVNMEFTLNLDPKQRMQELPWEDDEFNRRVLLNLKNYLSNCDSALIELSRETTQDT